MGDEPVSSDVEAERKRVLQSVGAPAAGDASSQTVSGQTSYFGFERTHQVMLPDGVSYFEHTEMTEGKRKQYLNATNRSLRIQKVTGDAFVNTTPGEDRHALLRAAITDWNLVGPDEKPLAFNERNLKAVMESFPPDIIDAVEKDIREHNKWLMAEMTVADIDAEIESLQTLREQKVKEEEGKAAS